MGVFLFLYTQLFLLRHLFKRARAPPVLIYPSPSPLRMQEHNAVVRRYFLFVTHFLPLPQFFFSATFCENIVIFSSDVIIEANACVDERTLCCLFNPAETILFSVFFYAAFRSLDAIYKNTELTICQQLRCC